MLNETAQIFVTPVVQKFVSPVIQVLNTFLGRFPSLTRSAILFGVSLLVSWLLVEKLKGKILIILALAVLLYAVLRLLGVG